MLILLSFYLCHPLLLTHSTSFIRHPFSPSVALIFPSQLLCLFSTFIISFVSSTWSLPQSSFSFLCHSLSINLSLSPYVSLTYFCHPFAHCFPFSPTPSSPFFNIFSSLHSLQPSVFLPFIFLSPIIFLLSPSILSSYLPPFPLPSSVLISLRYPSSLPLYIHPLPSFHSFPLSLQPPNRKTNGRMPRWWYIAFFLPLHPPQPEGRRRGEVWSHIYNAGKVARVNGVSLCGIICSVSVYQWCDFHWQQILLLLLFSLDLLSSNKSFITSLQILSDSEI